MFFEEVSIIIVFPFNNDLWCNYHLLWPIWTFVFTFYVTISLNSFYLNSRLHTILCLFGHQKLLWVFFVLKIDPISLHKAIIWTTIITFFDVIFVWYVASCHDFLLADSLLCDLEELLLSSTHDIWTIFICK